MNTLLRFISIWGIFDGIWLAARPKSWCKTWGKVIAAMGEDRFLSRLGGGLEILLCFWLLRRLGRKR